MKSRDIFMSKNDKQTMNATSLICVLKNMCSLFKKITNMFSGTPEIYYGAFSNIKLASSKKMHI